MGGCAAINCSNHSRNKFRMFKFPSDEERKRKWTVNCRRDGWVPGPRAELCSVHFEESQFEIHRADGWKKLKPNAVPTLFDVPNPPAVFCNLRIKGKGLPKVPSADHVTEVHHVEFQNVQNCASNFQFKTKSPSIDSVPDCVMETSLDNAALLQRIADLELENNKLKIEIDKKDIQIRLLKLDLANKDRSLLFLTREQVEFASRDQHTINQWSNAGIIKGLKLRFALGKFGYSFLRSTGYPAPSYSTLNRRLQGIPMGFGIAHNLLDILEVKIKLMDEEDKLCAINVDEMEISAHQDFDTSTKSFVGNVTLGDTTDVGNHYTVIMLRGLKSPWKQVVAHEITNSFTAGDKMKKLMCSTIDAVQKIGLKVKALVSDMGPTNKSMWKSFGVDVSRSERSTTFTAGSETIHTIADVPHLLKNMRGAILSRMLVLPEDIRLRENLPTRNVSSGYIKYLWIEEINSSSCQH